MRRPLGPAPPVLAAVAIVLTVAAAAAGTVTSRSVTVQGARTPGAAGGEVLSRSVTLQRAGIAAAPTAAVLGRIGTLQRLRAPQPPSAPVVARAFSVFKNGGTTDVPQRPVDSPALTFVLHPASPNPVHRAARLSYELADPRPVRLDLIDAGGRRVRTLANAAARPAGRYVVEWDGTNDDGVPVPAGVYWLRLVAGSFDQSRKVVLLRD